jgi:hypothetical protein
MALRKFKSDEARDSRGRWATERGILSSANQTQRPAHIGTEVAVQAQTPAIVEGVERKSVVVVGNRPTGQETAKRSLIRSSLAARASKTLIPPSYTGSSTPERSVDAWKELHLRWQEPPDLTEGKHETLKSKLTSLVRNDRQDAVAKAKVTRQLVAVNGYRDKFTEKRRIGPLTLDPATPRGAANRAYNHAAMLALHDFGIVDYDFKLSDHQKAELTPLIPFMRFVRRRLWNAMRSDDLKGANAPYRDAFGKPFPKPKFTPDGKERIRLRPNLEFIKLAPIGAYHLPVALPLAKALLTEPEVRAAARSAQIPTKAQVEPGNYQKGHLRIGGLPISIETPKGRTRRGIGANGRAWSVRMPAHYGYVRGSVGADGDHVDIYLGPDAHKAPELPVFIVDQVNAKSRRFDEHKVLAGFPTRAAAIATYDAGFSDGLGPKRRGAVCRMSWPAFRDWLAAGDTTKPLALPA